MTKITNIFFIDRFPLTKEFYIRYEFNKLSSKGYNVKFLDVSKILKRRIIECPLQDHLHQYRLIFKSKKDFISFVKQQKDDSIIITSVPYNKSSAWMYYSIFYYKISYVLIAHLSFPKFNNESFIKDKISNVKHFFNKLSISKIVNLPSDIRYYFLSKIYRNYASMVITSKNIFSTSFKNIINNTTVVKYTYSPDYDIFKKENLDNSINEINKPYAVFIDQYFCHHPDFKTNHITHSFTAEQYYNEINRFLLKFREKSDLEIIIASHPRRKRDYHNDFNENFELLYNQTAKLIKNAQVVLMHFSTAISYCVLFKKPFILLNSDLFVNSNIHDKIKGFSLYFNNKDCNISEYIRNTDLQINDMMYTINKELYRKYEYTFLKHPKAEDKVFTQHIFSLLNSKNQSVY